ncbi:MAG: hypothetical protein ACR2JC_09545 [Chloroflexota bacterium]
MDEILPSGENDLEIWQAVWEAYVMLNPPYDVTLELLRGHYRLAIDRLSSQARGKNFKHTDGGSRDTPSTRIGPWIDSHAYSQ